MQLRCSPLPKRYTYTATPPLSVGVTTTDISASGRVHPRPAASSVFIRYMRVYPR